MKNKAPLVLMEQLAMLLIFALAAGLCLQVFVFTGQMSQHMEAKDRAVTIVQNTAEALRISGGDKAEYRALTGLMSEGENSEIGYDENWEPMDTEDAAYILCVSHTETGIPLLGMAKVSMKTSAGEQLFAVTVSWQEAENE